MKNIIFLVILLLLGSLKSCNSLGNVHGIGILTLENQSNYDINIEFYILDTILTDVIKLSKNGELWQKHYEEKGGLNIATIFVNQLPSNVNARTVNTIVVTHDKRKVQVHSNSLNADESDRQQLVDSRRHLLEYDSYVITTERSSIGCKTGEENYRYIFTNADYEAAKPIDP